MRIRGVNICKAFRVMNKAINKQQLLLCCHVDFLNEVHYRIILGTQQAHDCHLSLFKDWPKGTQY